MPLAQREYLDVRVVGKTPRPAETTTRHCQPGGEGHTFGADSESEFLGLQLWASTPVASPAALRHHPRQEPRALTRMRGSVRGDWRKPVPYRDAKDDYAHIAQAAIERELMASDPILHQWKAGSILVLDNWKILHGRESCDRKQARRVIYRSSVS